MTNEETFLAMSSGEVKAIIDGCEDFGQLWKRLKLSGKSTSVYKKWILDKGLAEELDRLWRRAKAKRRPDSYHGNSGLPFLLENLEKIFCVDSIYDGPKIRRTIRSYNHMFKWFPEECAECGIPSVWNGKPLTLQVEHKNGVDGDHSWENLCLLCPNCHSQTLTYAAKNRGRKGDDFYLKRDGTLEHVEKMRDSRAAYEARMERQRLKRE